MNRRLLNMILSLMFLVLLLVMPVRALLFTDYADTARGEGAQYTQYVLTFLFGSFTLVFAYRAWTGKWV